MRVHISAVYRMPSRSFCSTLVLESDQHRVILCHILLGFITELVIKDRDKHTKENPGDKYLNN